MEKRILIHFLLASCVTEFSVMQETLTDLFSPMDYSLLSKAPYIYDDDDNLIKITYDDDVKAKELTIDIMGEHVSFYLYTKKNPNRPERIYVNDDSILKKSSFNPKKPTRFVTHGWMNSARSSACTLVRDAYLKHGDYNVIVIDWSSISFKLYLWASRHVKLVGYHVSELLNFLQKNGMNMSETIIVGHSLGAHVVGLGARNCNGTIGYVVGLDPALPGFYLAGPGSRISQGDANHVEIIHSNAGLLGYHKSIGHADFYPNGGIMQPGCLGVGTGSACSHARSFRFFAESINSPVGFQATKCISFFKFSTGLCKKTDKCLMGGLKTDSKGVYYLTTKSSPPYAKG